jgi:hypothetical protein
MFKVKKTRSGRYPCPVCGFLLHYPADDFNICPSCGVEFGYETAGRSYDQLRQEWVNSGALWASRVIPEPPSWNPYVQMNAAGLFYLPPFTVENVARPDEFMEILKPEWRMPDGARVSIVIR